MISPGFYTDLTNDAYHADRDYLGSTQLQVAADSLAALKCALDEPHEPTDAMTLGTATHSAILENKFEDIYVAVPKGMVRNEKQTAYKDFLAANPGKLTLKQEDFDAVRGARDAVFGDPEVMQYLKGGAAEASLFSMYPEKEIRAKCRPDYLLADRALSVNFKTTSHKGGSTDAGFIKSCRDYHYEWQSAWYIDLLSDFFKRTFDEVHIVVEMFKPYSIGVYYFDDDELQFARNQYLPLLERIASARATGSFPNRPVNLQPIKLPQYSRKVVTS